MNTKTKLNWGLIAVVAASLGLWALIGGAAYYVSRKPKPSMPNISCSCRIESSYEWDMCFRWAFGDDWKLITDNSDFPDRWNERHGDIFYILGSDGIKETNERIFKAWKDSK